jgi:dTDP-4-dehydrorhamnose 3,5-epimerase
MSIIVEKTKLENVLLIKPFIFEDHRGSYVEIYNLNDYFSNNIKINFVRDDISTSSKNVLRGIHYDNKTWKLIQCLYGKIYLVVIDMRPHSPQYLQWQSFILTSSNRLQVLVPPNFGNGHLVLSEECIFHYKMSEYYDPENEKVLKWDDPKANIFWPIKNPILSLKDATANYLK